MRLENKTLKLHERFHSETSKIAWQDLQRFFAKGQVIFISEDLDLIDVACQIAENNKAQIETWMQNKEINKVSDEQALNWYKANSSLWSVVVKPWILVQELRK